MERSSGPIIATPGEKSRPKTAQILQDACPTNVEPKTDPGRAGKGRSSFWTEHPRDLWRMAAEMLLNGATYPAVQQAIGMETGGEVPSKSQIYRLKRDCGLVQATYGRQDACPTNTDSNTSTEPEPAPTQTGNGEQDAHPTNVSDLRKSAQSADSPDSGGQDARPTNTAPDRLPAAAAALCSYEPVEHCQRPGMRLISQNGCLLHQIGHHRHVFLFRTRSVNKQLNPPYFACLGCPNWLSDEDQLQAKRWWEKRRKRPPTNGGQDAHPTDRRVFR